MSVCSVEDLYFILSSFFTMILRQLFWQDSCDFCNTSDVETSNRTSNVVLEFFTDSSIFCRFTKDSTVQNIKIRLSWYILRFICIARVSIFWLLYIIRVKIKYTIANLHWLCSFEFNRSLKYNLSKFILDFRTIFSIQYLDSSLENSL